MKRLIAAIIIVCFTAPLTVYAFETYETVYVNGQAPIVIDGDLSDWEWVGVDKARISNYSPLIFIEKTKPSPADLSGWFSCFADDGNLYVAAYIIDDKVVTGNHEFGNGWMDDVVEICFDGDLKDVSKPTLDINDGQITVVAENGDLSYVAGRIPGLIAQIPYYWEARGVRAGYSTTAEGYIAELLIPLEILGHTSVARKQIGFNVRILDDDSDGPDSVQGVMSWAHDPKNTSPWTTEAYNRISFTKNIDIPSGMSAGSNTSAMSVGAQKILLRLGSPDSGKLAIATDEVNEALYAKDWNGALAALEPLENCVWSQAIRGAIALHNGQFKEGVAWLDEYSRTADDRLSAEWARTFPLSFAEILGENDSKIDYIFSHNTVADGVFIYNEYLKLNPADEQALEKIKWALNTIQEGSSETIEILESVSSDAATTEIAGRARLAIARCYFYNGDYKKAVSAAKEIESSGYNEETKFDAKMVLMSVELKKESE